MTHYERERDTRSFLYSMRISRMRIIDKREEDAVLDQTKASRRATELKPSLWLNSLLLLCIGKKIHRVQTIPGRRKYSILAHFLSPISIFYLHFLSSIPSTCFESSLMDNVYDSLPCSFLSSRNNKISCINFHANFVIFELFVCHLFSTKREKI